jgi:transcriptional regulator with XRE-family HTH domain
MQEKQLQHLNNCLRKYRMARGLKQKEAAVILAVSTSMISRWEKGVCMPDFLNVLKMSLLYRTMIEGLFIDHVRYLKDELRKKEEASLIKQEC